MNEASRILCQSAISLACLAMVVACSSEVDAPEPLDRAMTDYDEFDCADAGLARVRFVGPDTIELLLNDESMILTSERAASGAKYAVGLVIKLKALQAIQYKVVIAYTVVGSVDLPP